MAARSLSQRVCNRKPIPAIAGVGLRAVHQAQVVRGAPRVGWFEVHSENFFGEGGPALQTLLRIGERYPISLHGVGLSLGSVDPLDRRHLRSLIQLARRVEPAAISEHLCWGSVDGRHTNDLLPLPYTEEALRHLGARIAAVQDALGHEILIENVSSYLQLNRSEMTEWEFLAALTHESGCGILLDINNIYVSAMNHGFDAIDYLNAIPRHAVREMHLAGHTLVQGGTRDLRIDTHDAPVCDAVWDLYGAAIERFGAMPTLIEWDANIPPLETLIAEADKADSIMEQRYAVAA